MSVKRKAGHEDRSANKRNRPSHGDVTQGGYEIKSRLDPVTGQRGAFPGLEDGGGDGGMFYGPAEDGMAYLRMVRAEAASVPSMFAVSSTSTANERPDQSRDKGARDADFAKLMADEAIIAEPTEDAYDDWDDDEDVEEEKDPQDVYYEALLDRFSILRTRLSNYLPKDSSAEPVSPAIQRTTDITSPYKKWQYGLTQCSPVPRYVAQLSQSQVMTGLERLETLMTKRNLERPLWRTNLSAWAWSLLAKCRDKSELDGDDIGVLRSLAKSAQRLGNKLRAMPAGALHGVEMEDIPDYDADDQEEGEEGEEQDENEGSPADPQDLEAARARLLGIFDSDAQGEAVDQAAEESNTLEPILMMLDSIVTVVGELYGQRDLLEQRAAW